MEFISYILLAVLALAMIMMSVFFVLLISKNMQNGRTFRRNLKQQLKPLRMTEVLKALGLDFDRYLHQSPVQQINQDISACKNCQTTSVCDEKISKAPAQNIDFNFCPVHNNLIHFAELNSTSA